MRIAVLLILVFSLACTQREEQSATNTGASDTTLTSTAGTAPPPNTATLAAADQEFFTKAAKIGMAEVQLATNVSQRATSSDVRSFAQRMITDHNASNQELMTLAANKRIDPPADVDPDKKELDARLAKLSGRALDKAYMDAMVTSHVAAAADFEKASQSVADPDLKAWATKNIPVLHDHHHLAESINQKLK